VVLVWIRGRTGKKRFRRAARSVQDVCSGGNVRLALREAEQGARAARRGDPARGAQPARVRAAGEFSSSYSGSSLFVR
jgi:hypothetical protein